MQDTQAFLRTAQDVSVEPSKIHQSTAVSSVVGQLRAEQAAPKRCVGLDLGSKIAFCEIRDGEVIQRATLKTKADLLKLLGDSTEPAQVAFEAGRSAWYYHDLLTELGHKVLVVDTTRVRALGIGHHRRKNDKIDAETLARAVETGRIPLAHVLSPERREIRNQINIRRALVKVRTEIVNGIRGLFRGWGAKGPNCDADRFHEAVQPCAKKLTAEQRTAIAPLVQTLNAVAPEIKKLDDELHQTVSHIEVAQLLMTCPGVGPVLAASFISVIDEADRFKSAHQVQSYLGLVPSENTSGKRKLGSITKAGNSYLRSLLVQASWNVLRSGSPLALWGQRLAKKRGKKVAAVAVARRLAGILWAMWRDGAAYDASLLGKASSRGLREKARESTRSAKQLEALG